ncbi:MAG: hypothetical protein HYU78_10200 [Rhodocyclales bacterium]|nr:hypothetical protein [Rhodocyclales bacterium]
MTLHHEPLAVHLPELTLHGDLALPDAARAYLVFVSTCAGSGAAAFAAPLQQAGFATLQIDLLQSEECRFADAGGHLPLLAKRLLAVIGQLHQQIGLDVIPALPVGLVASGQATPAAVRVAAQRDQDIRALVCHGGLIDLAGLQYLKVLQAPLLFVADPGDTPAVDNARRAQPHLPGICKVEVLPEADALARAERLAALSIDWFHSHLIAKGR